MEENIEFSFERLNFEVSIEEPRANARQETGSGWLWTDTELGFKQET